MRLQPCQDDALAVGRLVLLESPDAANTGDGRRLLFRMITRVDASSVALEPVALLIEDDDVTEVIPRAESAKLLHIPIWEAGDPVCLDGRPGRIQSLIPHDLHVTVKLDPPDSREVYANIIRMDLSPAIESWRKEHFR